MHKLGVIIHDCLDSRVILTTEEQFSVSEGVDAAV